MKNLTLFKTITVVICLFLSQPSLSLDLPLHSVTGHIDMINNTQVIVSDMRYKLSPTLKIRLRDNKTGNLSDLQKGDFVGISLLRLDRTNILVDTIQVLR